MMRQTESFEYFEAADHKGIVMPYGNGHFIMVVILPDEGVNLSDIVSGIDDITLTKNINTSNMRSVQLRLPKFTFECELELKAPLISMGMKSAFSDNADLSGIGTPENLSISSVKHKTFVEVNEEGTEAAAVTSVTVGVTSIGPGDDIVPFIVDRPFLFMIREKDTGAVIFMGQVYDPS
jgi:serpin B